MLILASLSPRRIELLRSMGLNVKVVGSGVDEDLFSIEDPRAHVLRVSFEKARVVSEREGGVVIGADTIVYLDGRIIGKPKDGEEARSILRTISGREHKVYTGFTIIDARGPLRTYQKVVESLVKIKRLTPEEVEWYVSTGEPMDKAGAYAIQGLGAYMVEYVKGSYTNVVGLPMTELVEALLDMRIISFSPDGVKLL